MKTLLIIICLLVTGTLVSVFTYQSPVTTEIVLLKDITDKEFSPPNTDEVLSLFNFSNENKWNGGIFRYSTLTDVSYNNVSEIKINPVNKWLSNEIERDREEINFKQNLSESITKVDSSGRKHSSVYFPVAGALKKLAESRSEKRILLVYSDLMENSPELSFYHEEEFKLLESNPDSLRKFFEKQQPLPSLNGIEVFIIYQPIDNDADKMFKEVSAFYKKLLEGKGAAVTISANLAN